MTDYSKMTDEQVNEAIFRAKGWQKQAFGFWELREDEGITTSIAMAELPDYTHDWRLAGELLEDMPGACIARDGIDAWYCGSKFSDYIDVYFEAPGSDFDAVATTPQRAICEAWLAWKELE